MPMPLMILALYSYWWKAALTPKEQITNVILLMPEDDAPELATTAPASAAYQG